MSNISDRYPIGGRLLGDGAWRRPKAWTIAPDGRVTVGKCRAAGVEISAGTMGSGVPGEQDGATVTPAWTAQTDPRGSFRGNEPGLIHLPRIFA